MKIDRSETLRALRGEPLAILPRALEQLIQQAEAEAGYSARRMPVATRAAGNSVVLPIYGPISQDRGIMLELFGGTNTDEFGEVFDRVVADTSTKTIILDIRSPGGSVYGVQELADRIFAARQRKNIVAVANSYAFSAAYWLGSQARRFHVTHSGEVGSIGVLAIHQDASEFFERQGIRHTIVKAGRHKAEGNPFEPLSDADREAFQASVNEYYSTFVSAVARGRGTTPGVVRNGFGQGRGLGARAALREGMVDGIATLQQVIGGSPSTASPRFASANRELSVHEARCRLAEMEA